jgi:hypothetical protein
VVDQLIHYVTIILTGMWIERAVGPVALSFSPNQAILAAAFLVATYVWFISERILTYADESYLSEVQAQLWPRMVTRAAMLAAVLWIMLWSGGMAGSLAIMTGTAVSVPYLSGKHRQRALLTDLSVSLVLAVLAGVALWL